MNHNKLKELEVFVSDDIKPYYFENIVAWVLNNCDIKDREDIPQLLGSPENPIQRAFTDYLCEVLNIN